MQDAIDALAAHVVGTSYEDLPDDALRAARIFVLDTIGVGLTGSTGPYLPELLATAARPADKSARVWGHGAALAPEAAALINGYQIHNSEFDCVHEEAVIHPMTVVTAAVTAHADSIGGVSGRDLILASVLGVDVACTLGVACKTGLRFFRPATAGAFAAVAGLSKVRGFDLETTRAAFGHVYGQLCGTMQPHTEGSPLLGLQIGFNARNALLACDLAAAGIPSIAGVLEGRFGYYGMIEGEGDIHAVLPELGRVWRLTQVAHKPFPSGRATHGVVDAAMTLKAEHGFEAGDIEAVTARVPSLTNHLVGRPVHDAMEVNYARLNGQYTMARVFTQGTLGIEDFTLDRIRDPAVIALARRISIEVDDNPNPNAMTPVAVEVRLKSGARHDVTMATVYGNPAKPMSREAHLEKFRRNHASGAGAMEPRGADDLIALVDRLEQVGDVKELLDLAVPR